MNMTKDTRFAFEALINVGSTADKIEPTCFRNDVTFFSTRVQYYILYANTNQ